MLKLRPSTFFRTMAVAALLLVACGDGEEGARTAGTPPPSLVLEGASAALVDSLTQGLSSTYKVTYETRSPEGEEGDTYIVFNKPPLTRIDTIPPRSSHPSSLLIGGESAAAVSCSGGPRQWECSEIEPVGDSLLTAAGPVVFLRATDVTSFDVREAEELRVAGQPTRCFRLSPRQGKKGDVAKYCLNPNGVPLYTSADFGIVEAIEFSAEVSDQEFVPPVEPQS